MSATIVIPTTMRRETVTPVAEAAVAAVSSIEGGEVILVANGSPEGRRSLGFSSPRLTVMECAVPRTSVARNVGLREARNDIVIFTDDDCLISREWVEAIARRLRGGELAVATALAMRRDGPITTFLDYMRIFHPRPLDASTVAFGLGASIAVRRDLVDTIFDEEMGPGDDVEFGRCLSEAGVPVGYASEAPPHVHLLPERLETLTERFVRYGTSNAQLFLRKGRPDFSIPHATSLYASLCRNELPTPRRFEEIADAEVRELFATYELVVLGNFLVGYLSRAGEILGRELVRVDRDALAEGWLGLEHRLGNGAPDRDWTRLPLDFERWLAPRRGRRPAAAGEIAGNLSRNAGLAEGPRFDPRLDEWADPIAQRADRVWQSANEMLEELRGHRLAPKADAIAWRLRERGIAFREGSQMIETIAQGPLEPAAPVAG